MVKYNRQLPKPPKCVDGDHATRFGSYLQCNPKWYANGNWSNYTELYNAVLDSRRSLSRSGIPATTKAQSNGTTAHFLTIDGNMYGAIQQGNNLIVLDGGSLISNQAGLISTASSDGHGGIVAAGAGNLNNPPAQILPTADGSYGLQAGEKRRIKVGSGTFMVVKKRS